MTDQFKELSDEEASEAMIQLAMMIAQRKKALANGTIVINEGGSMTMKLAHPIEHNGHRVEEINLRRARAKDVVAVEDMKSEAKALRMLSLLSGVDEDTLGEMDREDFGLGAVLVLVPFEDGQQTGKREPDSSPPTE